MARALLICCLFLAACTAPPTPADRPSPMLYDPAHIAKATELVIATPGALTTAAILVPVRDWETHARAVAFYRLPGFDGRPAGEVLSFDRAAADISAFVRTTPARRVYFVGFSMGNAINLEAAKRLRQDAPDIEIRVAAMSTALPNPQPTLAGLRGMMGTLRAALTSPERDRKSIWLTYYRRLLYGPDVDAAPETAKSADRIVAQRAPEIFVPSRALGRAHTWDLLHWDNDAPQLLDGVPITLFHGADDPVFPLRAVRRFAATLPDATLLAYPGDGHLIFLTRADQIFDDIARVFGFVP